MFKNIPLIRVGPVFYAFLDSAPFYCDLAFIYADLFYPKPNTPPANTGIAAVCFVYVLPCAKGNIEIVLAVAGMSISSALSAASEALIDFYLAFSIFGKLGIYFLSGVLFVP